MVVEHYEYLLLELEARNREQQKEFLKSIMEGSELKGFQKGKLEERKMVLELIDNYICDDNECKECLNMRMLRLKLQKEIGGIE